MGNILTVPNMLTVPDVLSYVGEGSGTYEIPASHVIDIGRVAPCIVLINWTCLGQHPAFNILSVPNMLSLTDVLDYAASLNIDVYPEIALHDGTSWGPWQKYVAGAYSARKFKARMQIISYDPTVQAILTSFTFSVDVPDRDDHLVGQSLASGGTTILYTPDGTATPASFNGGPNGAATPNVQVTIVNAQPGDDLVLTGQTLSGCVIQVKNAGVGVARTVNILIQGY
jgi:hypothetical protein